MKVIIAGAAGRMGRELLKYAHQNADIDIVGASEESGSDWIGKDIGEVIGEANMNIKIVSDILELIKSADVIIDFTNPETTLANAVLAAQARISHIIGTTGFQNEEIERLKKAGNHAVLVQSGNMSLGINILSQMTEKIARILLDFDIEITEIHHNQKVDAPSGTALILGESAAKGRSLNLENNAVYERHGNTGRRDKNTIGFSSIRGGSIVGEHSVIFAGDSEVITLSHSALSRKIFVKGAMLAARWSLGKDPGYYSMDDVLNIEK